MGESEVTSCGSGLPESLPIPRRVWVQAGRAAGLQLDCGVVRKPQERSYSALVFHEAQGLLSVEDFQLLL